jgi:hypothetical protein
LEAQQVLSSQFSHMDAVEFQLKREKIKFWRVTWDAGRMVFLQLVENGLERRAL